MRFLQNVMIANINQSNFSFLFPPLLLLLPSLLLFWQINVSLHLFLMSILFPMAPGRTPTDSKRAFLALPGSLSTTHSLVTSLLCLSKGFVATTFSEGFSSSVRLLAWPERLLWAANSSWESCVREKLLSEGILFLAGSTAHLTANSSAWVKK